MVSRQRTIFLVSTFVCVSVALVAAAVLAIASSSDESVKQKFRRPDMQDATQDPVWQLGERLFFDPIASRSGKLSCATCHDPAMSWSTHDAQSRGDNGKFLPFKSPNLFGAGQLDRLGWSGRFKNIEAVAIFAMSSPANMDMPTDKLVAKLQGDADYRLTFAKTFPTSPTISQDTLEKALTRFVGSIQVGSSPFDRWIAGDTKAISPEAQRGFAVFTGKGRCSSCHSGWSFSDGSYHDIGTSEQEIGLGKNFPTSTKLQHAFKTPSLRGVTLRAPYMHNGAFADLDAVLDLYNKGGIDRPSRADDIRPLHLTAQDKSDLKVFLGTLNGDTAFLEPTASH